MDRDVPQDTLDELRTASKEPAIDAVVGIDLGSSYIKAIAAEIRYERAAPGTQQQQQICAGRVNPNRVDLLPSPVQTAVTFKQGVRPTGFDTRGQSSSNITPADRSLVVGSNPGRDRIVVMHPKRGFYVKAKDVGADKIMTDIGLSSDKATAHADESGYVAVLVMHRGVPRTIKMEEFHECLLQKPLERLHSKRRYTAVPVAVITVPDGSSSMYRAAGAAVMARAWDGYTWRGKEDSRSELLRYNRRLPLSVIVPESVAAARHLCRDLTSKECVLIIDVGHATMAASLLEYVPGGLPNVIARLSNSFRGAQDTEHALLGWLAEHEGGSWMRHIIDTMKELKSADKGLQLLEHLRTALEEATGKSHPEDNVNPVLSAFLYDILQDILPDGSPEPAITLADVQPLWQPLADGMQQLTKAAIEIGKLSWKFPTKVYLTGGGAMTPPGVERVKAVVAEMLPGQGVLVIAGDGGLSKAVAMGATELGLDYLKAHAAGAAPLPELSSAYTDLLPQVWTSSICYHIAVWYTYSAAIVQYMTLEQLEDFKPRVHAAAKLANGEPDLQQRESDQQLMLDHINYHIARRRAPSKEQRPEKLKDRPTNRPFYYSVVLPQERPPVRDRLLPWRLYTAKDSSSLPLKMVKIDPQFEDEVVVAAWTMQNPGPKQSVSVKVSVDLDCQLECTAELHNEGADQGQPLAVNTDSDSYEAQRRDAERKLPQLPPLAQEFKRIVSGQTPLVPEAAAGAAVPAVPAVLQMAAPPPVQPLQPPPPLAAAAAAAAAGAPAVGGPLINDSSQRRAFIAALNRTLGQRQLGHTQQELQPQPGRKQQQQQQPQPQPQPQPRRKQQQQQLQPQPGHKQQQQPQPGHKKLTLLRQRMQSGHKQQQQLQPGTKQQQLQQQQLDHNQQQQQPKPGPMQPQQQQQNGQRDTTGRSSAQRARDGGCSDSLDQAHSRKRSNGGGSSNGEHSQKRSRR